MYVQVGFRSLAPALSRPLQCARTMRRTFLGLALMVAGLCALVQHLQLN
jgi:hypothetical protein